MTRRDKDGNVIGVVGVAQDITELLSYKKCAAAESRELRLLIETANAPIFGVDDKLNCNEWNVMTEYVTGFKKDEAMGKPLVQTFIT
eukprot:gene15208-14698_t